MTGTDTDYRERLAAEAKRVRDSGDLGRSEPLIRLFDFLVERSLDGRIPREIEIAQDVFDKTHDFDGMLDASVRVYIHRLRRKLAEHYARAPGDPDWISIPLGEYRVVLASPPAADEAAEQPEPPVAPPKRSINRVWLALIALALVNALAWIIYVDRSSGDDVAVRSNLWRPIADNKRPTLVVLGDYYIFGDAADGIVVSRLMRDFAINSREELDRYLMLNPDKVGSYVDVNLHYLPVSVGRGLRSLLPIVNAATNASGERPGVETMSDMKPEIFKAANVVYLGFLSGLGALQDPLFRASGFKVGDNFDELIDKATGRRFKSDWGVVADGKVPQRDYGYIASMLGPTGNRILIIAGTRDPAVAQMAEIAADQEQLKAIDAKSGGGAFEALFEVRTLGNLNLGSSLVLARPIRAESIWQPERPSGAGNSSHPAN
ncbi:helix-turn-helix domain-containing protein [Sphingomonas aurantiaca]